MTANDTQIAGKHYQMAIQPWDFTIANNLDFLQGSVVKYVCRYKQKNGIQDLQKARHFLDKMIEVEHARAKT